MSKISIDMETACVWPDRAQHEMGTSIKKAFPSQKRDTKVGDINAEPDIILNANHVIPFPCHWDSTTTQPSSHRTTTTLFYSARHDGIISHSLSRLSSESINLSLPHEKVVFYRNRQGL